MPSTSSTPSHADRPAPTAEDAVVGPREAAESPLTAGAWSRDAGLRVLVLTADVGCGHGRAAAAITLHLRTHFPQHQTRVLDALAFCPRWFTLAYRDLYLLGAKHLPRISGKIYHLSDRSTRRRSVAHRLETRALRRLVASPEVRQADLIITTHFLTARVLSHLRGRGELQAPLVVVVTDQYPHAVWRVRHADLLCVASASAREVMVRDGIPPERVAVTGIPIDSRFHEPMSREEARSRHQLPQHRPVILLSGGGLGLGGIDKALDALMARPGRHHVVVVCGKNTRLHKRLTARYGRGVPASEPSEPQRPTVTILGHTSRMHELMAAADLLLGKPGGLTTSEAAARGLPMVLLRPLPGQEQHNAAVLTAAGVARLCENPHAAGELAASLVDDPAAMAAMRSAARRFAPAHPTAAVVQRALALVCPSGEQKSLPPDAFGPCEAAQPQHAPLPGPLAVAG